MKVAALALGPVRPTNALILEPPLERPPTRPFIMATLARPQQLFLMQVKLDVSIVYGRLELRTTRVQDEFAVLAVEHKPAKAFAACITCPLGSAGKVVVEPEFAFVVEGVLQGGKWHGTSLVKVEIALAALVFGTYAGLLAPVAPERLLGDFSLEPVSGVAGVRDGFIDSHGS